ncbi:heavy-metal-associated domain-containing protein [Sandarakinorhabdus sp.]|uniref:heavy-metal-associated domain-containing protein n=1 Tax=Sandarakinorhabdus sp. TaxID=1916663 RepID=UPI00286E4EF9|nr:heavy-metal-associated domain-containing protein [Sandarakinorhabdus sp.]
MGAVPAVAAPSGGSAYAVSGIEVDVAGPNPLAARNAAWRLAQRRAWPILWERLTGQLAASAPRLSDGQIDAMVAGIESQGERFSEKRYIARLGVIFDRSRAAVWLSGTGAALQSPPMLLLPLWIDGGAAVLYRQQTPWRAAWTRYRENVTPLDYVLAQGSPGDNLVLTGWQVHRADRGSWRVLLDRFDASDVLTAEARMTRSWPGGPVTGVFIARHGPDATELGRFTLRAPREDGLDAMLDAAVRRMDDIYAAALRAGLLKADSELAADLEPLIGASPRDAPSLAAEAIGAGSSLMLAVVTPDAAAAAAAEGLLRSLPGISGVVVTSLSLGGTTRIAVSHSIAIADLERVLDARGWRIDRQGAELLLRRRLPADAPLPPPVVAVPPAAVPVPAAPVRPAGVVAVRPAFPAAVKEGAKLPPPVRLPAVPPKAAAPPVQRPAQRPPAKGAPADLLPAERK